MDTHHPSINSSAGPPDIYCSLFSLLLTSPKPHFFLNREGPSLKFSMKFSLPVQNFLFPNFPPFSLNIALWYDQGPNMTILILDPIMRPQQLFTLELFGIRDPIGRLGASRIIIVAQKILDCKSQILSRRMKIYTLNHFKEFVLVPLLKTIVPLVYTCTPWPDTSCTPPTIEHYVIWMYISILASFLV